MSGRPFYRSTYVLAAFVLTGAFGCAALSPLAPAQWHDTPSLRWLHTILPWWLMSAGFAIYVVLIVFGGLGATVVGEYLGLVIYLLAFIALIVTLRWDRPTNPFAILGAVLACTLHYAAARLTLADREDTGMAANRHPG